MTTFLLLLTGLVVVVIGTTVLRIGLGYTLSDMVMLAFLLFPVVTLSRFNILVAFMFLGRPYLGYFTFLSIWLVIFLAVRLASGQHVNLRMATPGVCLASIFVLGILSGLVNEGSLLGIGAPLQAALQWAWPLVVTYLLFKSMPSTLKTHERMVTSYVITYGYVAPLLAIFSSVFRVQLAAILGWEHLRISPEAGFARGVTPVGGAVIVGFLVVPAFALCVAQILRRRRTKFHSIAAILCVVALMFTLTRSAFICLAVVSILMFRGIILRYIGRIAISAFVSAVLFVPILIFMSQKYDFGRLLETGGASVTFRASSAMAAVGAGLENPILGKGPGLFYSAVRLPMPEEGYGTIVVSGRYSAAEPHNAYLLFFVENGLIGLAFLITVYVLFIRRMSIGRMLCNILPQEKPISNAYWAIMVTMAVFALTSSTLWVYMKQATNIWPIVFLGFHHVACMEDEIQQASLYQHEPAYSETEPADPEAMPPSDL